MPPFPGGFIISFIKCWEISSFRDSEANVFRGADSARLRVASIASSDLDNLQRLSFQHRFCRHPDPALAQGSGVSHYCCPRGDGGIGTQPSIGRGGPPDPTESTRRSCSASGQAGTVAPTVPKGVSRTHPGRSHPSKAWRAPRNLNAQSSLHRGGLNLPNFHRQI